MSIRVMVIEDEEAINNLICTSLRVTGHLPKTYGI